MADMNKLIGQLLGSGAAGGFAGGIGRRTRQQHVDQQVRSQAGKKNAQNGRNRRGGGAGLCRIPALQLQQRHYR